MTEYEIIADPKEYGIEKLVDGLNGNPIEFPAEERAQWAKEVGGRGGHQVDAGQPQDAENSAVQDQ